MSPSRRLVINADDFGLSAGVNRGILEAHRAGTVGSASLLVNTPGFADAVEAARAAPGLDVGLHLNLTTGSPVAAGGGFHPLSHLVALALAGRIDARAVAAECAAQIERLRATGLRITHLDGHEHVHVLPGIWRPVVETARRAGIAVVRVPLEPPASMAWRPLAAFAQGLLAAAHRVAARGGPAPLRRVDHFRGFALTGRRDFQERLLALLDRLESGVTELMVHPGHPDDELKGWVRYGAGRERELAGLTSAAVRARLARGDIALVGFGEL